MINCIVACGGSGARVGSTIPKQYISVFGKPVFIYNLEVINQIDYIDNIYLIIDMSYKDKVINLLKDFNITKNVIFIPAANTCMESENNAFKEILNTKDKDSINFLTNAVNPFINKALFDIGIKHFPKYDVIFPYINLREGIFCINDKQVTNIQEDRYSLIEMQTPITLNYNAINTILNSKFNTNSIIENSINNNLKIYPFPGNRKNIKITYSDDLKLMESIICYNNLWTKEN